MRALNTHSYWSVESHPIMRYQMRWVLPVAQLLLCFVTLWPARGQFLVGLTLGRRLRAPAREGTARVSEPQPIIDLPELTPERQREVDAAYERALLSMRVPVVLNFPVAVAQVPYLLATKREWVPEGVLRESWRALIWPLVGTLFWWLTGRGIEALLTSFQRAIHPRLHLIEVTWAVVLLIVGITTFVGIVTSTPDDRADRNFMALMYGGVLWGILAGLTVTARFRQWRIGSSNSSKSSPFSTLTPSQSSRNFFHQPGVQSVRHARARGERGQWHSQPEAEVRFKAR